MKKTVYENYHKNKKILGLIIAACLGVNVCAFAEEAGDTSVFEEQGSELSLLEESSLARKQLENLLARKKNTITQDNIDNQDNISNIANIDNTDNVSNTANVTNMDNDDNLDNADNLANVDNVNNVNNLDNVTNISNEDNTYNQDTVYKQANIDYEYNADFASEQNLDTFSQSIRKPISGITSQSVDTENNSIGQRFLENYYSSLGRSYSDTPRQIDKIIENMDSKSAADKSKASSKPKSGSGEAKKLSEGKSLGQKFLERYKAYNEPDEPLIMTDPALSDYPERSIDCQYLDYTGGQTNIIFVKPGFKTDVLLPAGDKLERITCGDRQRFDITTYYDKSDIRWHVYIQPYQQDMTTNIIISTDRHNFQAKLETTEFLKPFVRWNLPDDRTAGYKDRNVVMDVEGVKDLNFAYAHKGKINPEWAPMNVFDDKHWNTYLSFEKDMLQRINPVILATQEDGSTVIVPYEKRGDILIMKKVYKAFDVRIGSHTTSYVRSESAR